MDGFMNVLESNTPMVVSYAFSKSRNYHPTLLYVGFSLSQLDWTSGSHLFPWKRVPPLTVDRPSIREILPINISWKTIHVASCFLNTIQSTFIEFSTWFPCFSLATPRLLIILSWSSPWLSPNMTWKCSWSQVLVQLFLLPICSLPGKVTRLLHWGIIRVSFGRWTCSYKLLLP